MRISKKFIVPLLVLAIMACLLSISLFVGAQEGSSLPSGTFLSGDANGDKVVDIRDLVCFKKHLADIDCDVSFYATDIDNNDNLDGTDLVLLRKKLLFDETNTQIQVGANWNSKWNDKYIENN